MILLLSLRPFLARYLPVLMAGIYVAFVGGTATVSLAGSTYFRAVPLETAAAVEFGVCMALSVVITLSNFMVLYGRSKWVWALVAYFIVCLLTALPTIQFSPNKFIYAESLFWPLLGLLILNSKRHREMRGKFLELRYRRKRIREMLRRGLKDCNTPPPP